MNILGKKTAQVKKLLGEKSTYIKGAKSFGKKVILPAIKDKVIPLIEQQLEE